MEQRNSLVVILLAALLGSAAIAPKSSVTPYPAIAAVAPAQSRKENEKSSTLPLRAHTAAEIVREFSPENVAGVDDAYALADAVSLGRLQLPEEPRSAYWSVDSLIATVPDPIESGLGSSFDDYVDSIERAVSDNGYELDQFYDPWPQPDQIAKSTGGDGSVTAGDDSQPRQQRVPPYELEPGLILFRDANETRKRLLVVFLVGETPTEGVHKRAFESALKQANAPPFSPGLSQIKVLGPSFSGSGTSMSLAIREWATASNGSAPDVEIISGSATGITKGRFEHNVGITYHTTIIPDESSMDALLSWLGESQGQNVAILSEENTLYGNSYGGKPDFLPKMLRLRYPLHIAELQRAAERAAQTAKTGASAPLSLSSPNLPMDSQGARSRRDLMQLYSTSEINSLELALDAILREIDEHRINYVVISATDPDDTLFLVHWIRQNCPKVTPIALGADLLFLHSDVNADTRGMIVASTYSLYLENQLWTLPAVREPNAIQFSLDASEGIYNATLKLLGGRSPLLDYIKPFSPDSESHPLWISIVGADQIWPISILDGKVPVDSMVSATQSGPGAATDQELRLYSKAFVISCSLIALGCCLVWSLIAVNDLGNDGGFVSVSKLRKKLPIWIQEILSDAVFDEYRRACRAQLLLLSAVLFCLSATVAGYFFLPFFVGARIGHLIEVWQWRTSSAVTALVLLTGLASIAPRSWFANIDPLQSGSPSWSNPLPRILLLVGLLAILVVVVCTIFLRVPPSNSTARLFLFLRTSDLGSKVSPLVPMLLTYGAAIALIFGALRRLALLESRQILTPFLNFGTASFSGFRGLEQRVRDLVGTGAWSWRTHCAIALPIGLAYLLALPFRQLFRSHIDTATFKCLFTVVSLAVYIGIGFALVRMVTVWLAVRKLLRRIYTHPSRGGYDAYRQQLHFLNEPAIDLLSKVPAMSQLEVALDQVRQLLITSDDPSTRASAEIEKRLDNERPWLGLLLPWVEQSINETEEAQAKGDWSESVRTKRQTEIWMAVLSWSIAHIFEPLWRTTGASCLSRPLAGTASKDSKPIDTIGEVYVASRVVDFLRQVMPQLESLALSTTLAMLLMLFAVSSYPFPARDDLLWFSWIVVLATVGSMMWMFFSLNRDRVASMIAGTTPGQTDWNSTLVLQVATHALLPILVLLGAAFPTKLGTFVTWIGSLFGGHA
jgi:hypothetical protein